MKHGLSEKWIKASIAGTIWAASEIVLGSFLHNLKIPFSGNILTAIGIIVLIAISYVWTDRGLFWRAGLICAVMKTMSPSAVIFGPMVAIITESILLEISVTLLGRTIAGYLLGSMLAMSWNLFQKVINFIIFYGSNIIEVYENLLKYAQKQLEIESDIVWLPIITLLVVYAVFGLFAGITGIRVGRKMRKEPGQVLPGLKKDIEKEHERKTQTSFNYSVIWLFVNVILIIGSFLLLSKTQWFIWSSSIAVIVVIWSLRYSRALRQLSRPGFWIFFVLITLVTAFALTDTAAGESLLKKGLLTGIQMNFRAVVIIVGFSVLGTELYNPVVRNFFMRTSFRNLPLAIELSVESLPDFIASIPDFKILVKNPVAVFYQVISHADRRLSELTGKSHSSGRVFIITGPIGAGKTNFAKQLSDKLKKNKIIAGGIITEKILDVSSAVGYDLVDIESLDRVVFLRQNSECGSESIGRFTICSDAIEAGNRILRTVAAIDNKVIIIDEVGMLELNGKGWSESINSLLAKAGRVLIITVRSSFIEEVIAKWNITDPVVVDVVTGFNDKKLEEITRLISD
ncbi:MAG: hypothetical protein IPN68_19130 [Bacteroidetes bacterium]|nr:hypothetical protein [Bacteroidota bacterium]